MSCGHDRGGIFHRSIPWGLFVCSILHGKVRNMDFKWNGTECNGMEWNSQPLFHKRGSPNFQEIWVVGRIWFCFDLFVWMKQGQRCLKQVSSHHDDPFQGSSSSGCSCHSAHLFICGKWMNVCTLLCPPIDVCAQDSCFTCLLSGLLTFMLPGCWLLCSSSNWSTLSPVHLSLLGWMPHSDWQDG